MVVVLRLYIGEDMIDSDSDYCSQLKDYNDYTKFYIDY